MAKMAKKVSKKQAEKLAEKKAEMDMIANEFAKVKRYETTAETMTVAQLFTCLKDNIIDKASFQRNFRWSDKDKSCLIESLLLGLIPPCLFAYEEQVDDENTDKELWKMKFHDGLQRSNSIYHFIKGKFALKGLTVLTYLNGKKWDDLPYNVQHALKSSKLHIIRFVQGTPVDYITSHFNRLNIKGVPLTQAEVFRGSFGSSYYDVISKLAEDEDFCASIGTKGTGKKKKELANEKMVMYWATLYHDRVWENGVVNYKNAPESKGGWIEEHMSYYYKNKDEITPEFLEKTKNAFNKAVKLNKIVLGDNYFRKPKIENGAFVLDSDGKIALGNTNNGLFECLMYFMSYADEKSVISNSGIIKDKMFNAFRLTPTAFDEFNKANQNAKSANVRFNFIYDVLKDCGVKFLEIEDKM